MKNNKMIIVLSTILVLLISVIIVLGINLVHKTTFVKPIFDELSSSKIPEDLNYTKNVLEITKGYSIYIDVKPIIDNDYLIVNFVSLDTNNIWIKIRILDKDGSIVGESGLIKKGEHLEKIKLNKKVSINDKITYVIMGYEIDTYLSAGEVNLNTIVGE